MNWPGSCRQETISTAHLASQAIASGCVKHGQMLEPAHRTSNFIVRITLSMFRRFMKTCRRLKKFAGRHPFTCRAPPAAFFSKSPACGSSGCSPLPLGIFAKRLDVVFMIFDLPLMAFRYGRSCGNPSMAPKVGMPTPGFGLLSSSALKAVQHERRTHRSGQRVSGTPAGSCHCEMSHQPFGGFGYSLPRLRGRDTRAAPGAGGGLPALC